MSRLNWLTCIAYFDRTCWTDLGEVSNAELGLHNHQVAVKDLVGGGADGLNNEGANGDVRNESPVHYINVDPIAARSIDSLDLRVM